MMATHLPSIPLARLGLLALLLAGTGCPDDPGMTPTTDTEADTTTTTDGPPVTTTIDPDTTAGMETTEGETTQGETEGETTEGATTEGAMCGNGMAEDGEDCDGEDLGGEDCESQGFGGGALQCADDCTFDTSGCTKAVCGNDMADKGEACDGTDLGGEDCESQGFAGGTLACLDDCSGFDTEACTAGASNCCEANPGVMGCDDPTCEADICALDDFCCGTEWDQVCADAATGADGNGNACAVCPAPVCGNDAIEGGEVCDGLELDGQDCTTQGFMSGNLACAGDCLAFDTTGCMDPIENADCCVAGMMMIPGCADAVCEAAVCGADAFCCDTEWDQICADAAVAEAACAGMGTCPALGVCGDAVIGFGEVCDGANLDGQDCVMLGYAGGGVLACAADCTAFDVTGCIADLTCSEQDVGSTTGAAVAMGTTVGADDDLDPSCGGTGGPDRVITFTAAMAGLYTFDTVGSAYDTKLAAYLECSDGSEIICNDDTVGLTSEVSVDLLAGQVVLLVVDGFNGATGAWVLNITGP
jgi:hypothetical protein